MFMKSNIYNNMKRISLLFIILFFINAVFGDKDEVKSVSVMEGENVTLHGDLTHIQKGYKIMWWFNGDRIARINRTTNRVYDDKRFTDRLKMNHQTGDLTITNITSNHTGVYQLEIINRKITTKTFSVSLSPKVKNVINKDFVSLHIDVTEKQRNDKIHWKIKHNNTTVAEIITQNGKISTHFIDERFRDRLKLDVQTGDLIITNMKNEDSGNYEADVTISNTHTIHKTFRFTGSEVSERFNNDDGEDVRSSKGLSSGLIAGLCVCVLLVMAGGVGVVIYCHPKLKYRGVIGDRGERVSVNDGGSVTLHTHLTDMKREDVIVWRFNGDLIAKINKEVSENPVYESDKRFTDRLKMNPQTGDLTITSEHTGDYKLYINGDTKTKTFSISLSSKVKNVINKDFVSLHIDVTEKQRNDKIHWKIKHNNTTVAEIITENGTITENKTYNKFRDRLKLDDQTGDLIITNMKNEDSGYYEADVTISNTHTIHKTFRFTGSEASGRFNDDDDGKSSSGLSTGVIAGICVGVLLVIAAVVVIFRRQIMNHLIPDSRTVVESMETNEALRNRDTSNVYV